MILLRPRKLRPLQEDPSTDMWRWNLCCIFFLIGPAIAGKTLALNVMDFAAKMSIIILKKYRGCRDLDEERMRIYGAGDLTSGCPYSSESGCILATHKAPKCIAYICPQFTKALIEQGINYDWFEVHTLLISILNEGKFDWWSGSKIESHYISDEEFLEIKSRFEELLNSWAIKVDKKTAKMLC
jgi:hypothetical protein